MKAEERENGITLVPETEFEKKILARLRRASIAKMHFMDDWEGTGPFYIDFDTDWGR